MGKRSASCDTCPTKTETVYVTDLDTVFQKGKSTVVKDPFKVTIVIRDTSQLDSLKRAASAREEAMRQEITRALEEGKNPSEIIRRMGGDEDAG